MKKFNKVITVEVQVDRIAEQLLNSFDKSFPHSDIVTEAIIGNLGNTPGGLSDLWNTLLGNVLDIDFKAGQYIETEISTYDWAEEKNHSTARKIGVAMIKEIDLYKTEQICLNFNSISKTGAIVTSEKWVKKTDCKLALNTAMTVPDCKWEGAQNA